MQEVRTNTLKHSRKFKKSFDKWLWVHAIYLFVFFLLLLLLLLTLISVLILIHICFWCNCLPFLQGKLELHVVSTTTVIHVSADVSKDPNVEEKTQNFSHSFLEHFYTQAHSACAFCLQYLRLCLSSQSFIIPLVREIES